MPAELMERPRRGTGRTQPGGEEGGRDSPPPAPGPAAAPRGGAAGDPRGAGAARLQRSGLTPSAPRQGRRWQRARDPLAPGLCRPSLPERWRRGHLFLCRLLTERH